MPFRPRGRVPAGGHSFGCGRRRAGASALHPACPGWTPKLCPVRQGAAGCGRPGRGNYVQGCSCRIGLVPGSLRASTASDAAGGAPWHPPSIRRVRAGLRSCARCGRVWQAVTSELCLGAVRTRIGLVPGTGEHSFGCGGRRAVASALYPACPGRTPKLCPGAAGRDSEVVPGCGRPRLRSCARWRLGAAGCGRPRLRSCARWARRGRPRLRTCAGSGQTLRSARGSMTIPCASKTRRRSSMRRWSSTCASSTSCGSRSTVVGCGSPWFASM